MKETKNMRKIMIIISIFAILLIISVGVTYAWFNNQRKIARMMEVVPINAIYLSAAHREEEINFQIGAVSVKNTNNTTKRVYVFSVSGQGILKYRLRLAHTANNPFNYSIYPATFSTNQPSADKIEGVDYVKYTATGNKTVGAPEVLTDDVTAGNVYYYTYNESGDAVSGQYKNRASSNPNLANSSGTYHDKTYDANDRVQPNAEPLYWESNDLTGSAGVFCNNYILVVEWPASYAASIMTKETDLVYLYATTIH